MTLGPAARTAFAGAAVAAAVGCLTGAYLRPETGAPDVGRTLVISNPPEPADAVSYESSWHAVYVGEEGAGYSY